MPGSLTLPRYDGRDRLFAICGARTHAGRLHNIEAVSSSPGSELISRW